MKILQPKNCLYLLLLTQAISFGCRSTKKPNVTNEPSMKLTVTAHGLNDADVQKYGLAVQLSQCFETVGERQSEKTYLFTVDQVRLESNCRIRVVGAMQNASTVTFFKGQTAGVFYEAANVVLSRSLSGEIVGDAYLQKFFAEKVPEVPTKTYTVKTPVYSTETLSDSCTCRISCDPEIRNNGSLIEEAKASTKETSGMEGFCSFTNAVTQSTQTSCKSLIVACGKDLFLGTYSSSQSVSTVGSATTLLERIVVKPANLEPEGSIAIKTEIKR